MQRLRGDNRRQRGCTDAPPLTAGVTECVMGWVRVESGGMLSSARACSSLQIHHPWRRRRRYATREILRTDLLPIGQLTMSCNDWPGLITL